MKLLVLGGTIFVGRHLVDAALVAGHDITLFNRGRHHADLFPEVKKLHGDRDGHLEALRGKRWDAVIDTCGYLPRVVRDSAELLADAVDHYTFISSVSAYANPDEPNLDESAPVGRLDDPTSEDVNGETYGPLKALCEEAVERALPGRALLIRPGLIVGPHDPSDRFTYWPHRISQGGDVLAPGRPEREVQFIDARDLAEWTLRAIESHLTGRFNLVGPEQPLTMLAFLEACRATTGSDARFVWADEDFLARQGIQPYSELPLWIPGVHDTASRRKAIGAALTYRLLEETISDTLAWDRTRPETIKRHAGLSPTRERNLLKLWKVEC